MLAMDGLNPYETLAYFYFIDKAQTETDLDKVDEYLQRLEHLKEKIQNEASN